MWMYNYSPIYINFNVYTILKEYIKCCYIFKSPKIVKYKLTGDESLGSDYFFVSAKSNNKWLEIDFCELGYKYKDGTYVYESCPYMTISWMNKVRYVFGLESSLWEMYFDKDGQNIKYSRNNDLYWETILDYLYTSKNLIGSYEFNIWKRPIYDEEPKKLVDIPITPLNMYRYKYQKQIMKHLNKKTIK